MKRPLLRSVQANRFYLTPNTHVPFRNPHFWANCMALALSAFMNDPQRLGGTVVTLERKTSKYGNPNETKQNMRSRRIS